MLCGTQKYNKKKNNNQQKKYLLGRSLFHLRVMPSLITNALIFSIHSINFWNIDLQLCQAIDFLKYSLHH